MSRENIADGIKEEYEGPLEDSNVSVCLEEDSYDPLEAVPEVFPEDNPPENPNHTEIPIAEPIIEEIEPQEDIPIGLRTKPTRRSARVRVKCAKRRIENVFEDSEEDESGDEGRDPRTVPRTWSQDREYLECFLGPIGSGA